MLRRIALGQDVSDLRPGEPTGQSSPLAQILLAYLRPRDRGRSCAFRKRRDLFVPVVVGDIHHLMEGDGPHSGLIAEPVDDLLGVVRAVERVACRVDSRAGVVTADDQVVGAVVAPDDGVPERLPGSGKPHRQRQERQEHPVGLVVVPDQRLIGADTRVVVHVPGLGEPHHRVKQEDAVHAHGGPLGEFLVGPVQGVAGLEGHDVRVAVAGQSGARLQWGLPQATEVVVRRDPQHPQRAGNVDPSPAVHLRHEGVPHVTGTEHLISGLLQVPLVRLLHCHDSQQLVTGIA